MINEERKTFVFYGSWYRALSRFSADIQLAAYNAVFRYALYGEKVSDSEDGMVRVAFEFIRENIDMAQAEYDAKSRKRSGAAQKRWSKAKDDSMGESQSLTSQKSTTSTTEPETEASEAEAAEPEENAAETKTTSTTDAAEEAAEGKKDASEEGRDAAEPEENAKRDLTAQQVLSEFLCHRRAEQLEGLAKELGVTRQTLETMALDVANEWRMTDMLHDSYTAGARHLVNTIRKKLSVKNNNKSGKPTPGGRAVGSGTQPKLGVGEYINERGERTYGRSGVVVPPNAPPRPSNGHWWHDISEAWLLTF